MLVAVSALLLTSCDNGTHPDEMGLAVEMVIPGTDAVTDVNVWIYGSDGKLVTTKHYPSSDALASDLIHIPAGKYTVVTATNLVAPFAIGETATLSALYATLTQPSASPAHAHFGAQGVDVKAGCITRATVKMSRVLAELQFTVEGVPSDVVSASVEVLNTAVGFFPGTAKLSSDWTAATIGTDITPKNGNIDFPLTRLMPVVAMTTGRATDATESTLIRFTFHYNNGGTVVFETLTPIMVNGGIYTPKVEYSIFRPGIVVAITTINGWIELPPITGEILNPDK